MRQRKTPVIAIIARMAALSLLMSVVAFTCMPVCGNALDVNPVASCEQHVAAHATGDDSDHSSSPAQCCDHGEHAYPAAHLQAPLTIRSPQPIVMGHDIQPAPITNRLCERDGYAQALLKIPLIPLYILTAVYRI